MVGSDVFPTEKAEMFEMHLFLVNLPALQGHLPKKKDLLHKGLWNIGFPPIYFWGRYVRVGRLAIFFGASQNPGN